MKYAIVIPDGCADEPQESLGGRTPLQAAHKPHVGSATEQTRRRMAELSVENLLAGLAGRPLSCRVPPAPAE